jgi:DNA-binding MurR/RpiR family transcriptional regulator
MESLEEFRQRLEQHFSQLTKSEQKLATFLLTNYDHAAFLNAADLAEQLQVSPATIVRFARSIGFKSFPELKRVLQEIFRHKNTPSTRLQHKLQDLKNSEGHILTKVVDMEVQFLAEVPHDIKPSDFDRAVKLLLEGKRIFVFGTGPSRILAELFELRLSRFGLPVISLIAPGRDLLDKLILLQRDDSILVTGFQRLTGELVAALNHAHKLGCRTVFLTDVLAPSFKDKADVILAARRGPVSTFHSLTVPMAILNAMILAIATEQSDESVAHLELLDELRTEYGLDVTGKITL